jgi:hypothetical protein
MDDWIPGQAHKLANDFRLHHGNDLSPELITELLRNLNNIWRIREKKAVARFRAKCNEEIVNLKRQMNAKMPMDTIILSKQITNLSLQLDKAKRELKDLKASSDKNSRMPVLGTELIDNTLQAVVQMQNEKKQAIAEKEALLAQVAELKQAHQS